MPNIDERVVKMTFNNDAFEQGVATTLATLDKLKNALHLEEAAKGLGNLTNGLANNFDVSPITDGLDTAENRFSLFDSFVNGVFMRLGSMAADFGVNLGKKLIDSMGLKAAMDGFGEYELQMGSIQTILGNTGLDKEADGVDQVNTALDKLNEYADYTIYNFSQMTRAVGTFTTAGQDLETSTNAIRGFSNLAALAGADANATASSMFQLSQAMSAGAMRLQDYMSLERTGIGGKKFQEVMSAVARKNGVDIDGLIDKYGQFRYTLQEGWLSADIMAEGLKIMTLGEKGLAEAAMTREEAQQKLMDQGYDEATANWLLDVAESAENSAVVVRTFSALMGSLGESIGSGWAMSWRLIVGDFDQASELFTTLSKKLGGLIDASSDARNAILTDWSTNGGRDALVQGIYNLVDALSSIVKPIGEAFTEVFGLSGKGLIALTKGFEAFTSKLILTGTAAKVFKTSLKLVFTVIRLVTDAVGVVMKIIGAFAMILYTLAKPFIHVGGIILDFVSDKLNSLLDTIKLATTDSKAFAEMMSAKFSGAFDKVKDVLGKAKDKFVDWFNTVKQSKSFKAAIKPIIDMIKQNEQLMFVYHKVKDAAKAAWDGLKAFAQNAKSNIDKLGLEEGLKATLETAANFLQGKVVDKLLQAKDRIQSVFNSIAEYFRTLTPDKLYGDLNKNVFGTIEGFAKRIGGEGLYRKVANALYPLKQFLQDILIGSEDFDTVLAKLIEKVKAKLAQLPDTIKGLFDQAKNTFFTGFDALKNEAGKIDPNNILINLGKIGSAVGKGLETIFGWITNLPSQVGGYFVAAGDSIISFFERFPTDKLIILTDAFKKLAESYAIITVAKSIKGFSDKVGGSIKSIAEWPKSLGDALGRLGEGFTSWKKETKADAFVKIAVGITALAGALFVVASLPAEDIMKAVKAIGALAAIAGILTVIIGVFGKLKLVDADAMSGFGDAVKGLGIGVLALAAAAAILAFFDEDALIKGVGSIVAIALAVGSMAALIGASGGSMLKASASLIIFAAGLALLLPIVYALGSMPVDSLIKGVGAISAIMIAIGLLGSLGGEGLGKILVGLAAFGAGFLAFTVGLVMLASGILAVAAALSQLDPRTAIVTLTTIAGAMIGFAFASSIAEKSNPIKLGTGILIFAAAMVVLGAAIGVMALIPFDRFISGVLAIAVALGGFAAMTAYLDAADLVDTANAIMKFALATLLLGGALTIIGALANLAGNGLLVVGLALAGLSAMAYALDAGKLQATATSILIFAGAMGVLALSLMAFSAIPVEAIVAGLVSMAVALGLFVLGALAAEALSAGFIVLGVSVLAFGLGVLAAAAGVAIFANTLMTLISFGGPLGEFVSTVFEGFTALANGIGKVVGWVKDAVGGFWDMITGKGDAKKAGEDTVTQYAEGVRAAEPILDQQINSTKQKVSSGLDDSAHLGDIGNAGGTAYANGMATGIAPVEGTANTAMQNVQGALNQPGMMNTAGLNDMLGLNGGMISGLPTVTGTADSTNNQLVNTLTNPEGFASAMTSNMGAYDGTMGNLSGMLDMTAFNTNSMSIDALTDPEGYMAAMSGNMSAYNSQLDIDGATATAKSAEVSDTVKNELSEAGNTDIPSPTIKLADSISSGADAAVGAATSIGDQVKAAFGSIDVTPEGSAAVQGFTSGEESGRGPATNTANSIATQAKSNMRKDASPEGSHVSGTFGSGINSGGWQARNAASAVASSTKSNLEFNGYDPGYYGVLGMRSGMDDAAGSVYAKASAIANTVAKTINNALQVKSPSRVTMKTGRYVDEGLILGMEKLQGSVSRASLDTANVIIDALDDTLGAMNVDLNDQVDTDITPKITPVLSSDSLDQDVTRLNGLLSGSGGAIASDPFGLNALNTFTMGSFVDSIGQLRDSNYILDQDIRNLTTAINNMQPSTIMDARGMVVNDPNTMASIANDVVDIFIRKGLM